MLSNEQLSTYKQDGLVKSSTHLSEDKVKDLNKALDKYLDDHKDENTELVTGLYERDNNFLIFIYGTINYFSIHNFNIFFTINIRFNNYGCTKED